MTRYMLVVLLLSGCSMTTADMAAAKKECEASGMGTRWFISGLNGAITSVQCDPTKREEK